MKAIISRISYTFKLAVSLIYLTECHSQSCITSIKRHRSALFCTCPVSTTGGIVSLPLQCATSCGWVSVGSRDESRVVERRVSSVIAPCNFSGTSAPISTYNVEEMSSKLRTVAHDSDGHEQLQSPYFWRNSQASSQSPWFHGPYGRCHY